MIERILLSYLKWSGKGYLVPFLNGLSHLGRPSAVAFPMELMEQGLAIVLSGLNNTMAIQSNLDWIWPLWVERQMDPDGEEFIPTAINLIKTNLTCRNWTSLGLEDSPREAMIDPVGMLTLRPYGWSVLPYVRMEGRGYFPPRLMPRWQVSQRLREGSLPSVITRYDVGPALDWTSEAMAMGLEMGLETGLESGMGMGRKDDRQEFIDFSHTLANRSQSHLSLKFGLAIRPYNMLTMGHINSIRYQDRLWRVNGENGLLLMNEPTRVVVSDRHHGDPLTRDVLIAGRAALRSRSGIACGQAEWDLELAPGEVRVIDALGMMGAPVSKVPAAGLTGITRKLHADSRVRQVERWKDLQSDGLRIHLPDPSLEEAFLAVKNHLHVFDDGDHFSPGTFLYHNHWFRDSSFIASAFENLGLGPRVEPKLRRYPGLQTGDGFFRSQRGEWDSNGEAMWTLVNHVRMGGNPNLLDLAYPSIIKGAKWIDKMRKSTRGTPSPHYGLMPPGFSAEHFGPNDHYYWDNLWSLAGLEAALCAAGKLGNARDAAWLEAILTDFRGDLAASMDWAWKKCGRKALPCSPYRSLDSAAIGNLVGVSPLHLLDVKTPWLAGTVDFLMENNLRDGLFFQRIVHTGLNPYLSVQLARALMALGDPRWYSILEALVRRASPTFTWPEAMHPRMYGGCMGDGDHGWSAAEFVNLIREMLVSDRGGIIRLAESAPVNWFRPGLNLGAAGAPTIHGTVSFSLRQGPVAAFLSWSLHRKPHQDPAPMRFSLPLASGLAPEGKHPIENGCYRITLPGDSGTMTFPSARNAAETAPYGVSVQQRIQHA